MSGLVCLERREVQLAKPSLTSLPVTIKQTAEERELDIKDDGARNEEMNQRYRPASCRCYDSEDMGVLCEQCLLQMSGSSSTLDPAGVRP